MRELSVMKGIDGSLVSNAKCVITVWISSTTLRTAWCFAITVTIFVVNGYDAIPTSACSRRATIAQALLSVSGCSGLDFVTRIDVGKLMSCKRKMKFGYGYLLLAYDGLAALFVCLKAGET